MTNIIRSKNHRIPIVLLLFSLLLVYYCFSSFCYDKSLFLISETWCIFISSDILFLKPFFFILSVYCYILFDVKFKNKKYHTVKRIPKASKYTETTEDKFIPNTPIWQLTVLHTYMAAPFPDLLLVHNTPIGQLTFLAWYLTHVHDSSLSWLDTSTPIICTVGNHKAFNKNDHYIRENKLSPWWYVFHWFDSRPSTAVCLY